MNGTRTCSIEGCQRVHYAHGFCRLHADRYRKHGDPAVVDAGSTRGTQRNRDLSIEWRPVVGYECIYEVSERGDITNVRTGQVLSGRPHPGGYLKYQLWRDRRGTHYGVHQIVARAFIGTPTGPVVRHVDDNPLNNHYSNLAYGTQRDNVNDSIRNGTYRNGQAGRTHCTNGHEYTPETTGIRSDGRRRCLTCYRKWVQENPRWPRSVKPRA